MSKAESVAIVGWGHTKFGKLEEQGLEDLLVAAANEALADAGVEAHEIDAIYVATFNAGMSEQDFISSLALQVNEAFRFTRPHGWKMPAAPARRRCFRRPI